MKHIEIVGWCLLLTIIFGLSAIGIFQSLDVWGAVPGYGAGLLFLWGFSLFALIGAVATCLSIGVALSDWCCNDGVK